MDLAFYKKFEKDDHSYKLVHDAKIENFRNIMYNEEDEMTQIKIIKVTQRKKRMTKFSISEMI
jgi:hypothetical protein